RCSTKRFVSETWSDSIYLSEDIHAYVSTGAKKYRCMTLKKHPHVWDKAEQNCYHLYHVHSLPDANEVLAHPEAYLSEQAEPQILLPYKFGMNFANMRIGTGFSIKNKKELFEQIGVLMCDFAEPVEYANPISQAKTVHMNDKNEPAFHRERLKSCTGMTGLHIEIYGHASDKALQNRIIADIETYLGTEEKSFPIWITCKELGALGDMMPDNTYQSHYERIQHVCQSISKAETITGAIVILPNTSGQEGDPKYALRAGFADSNRLTQFITPDLSAENEEAPSESRIHGAVMDLLRQFGYTEFSEKRQMLHNPAFEADTIGMYIMHQLKPLWAKTSRDIARFLPVYVTYQVRTGQLFVDCDLLKKRHMSYPEALLTLSVLSRNTDFVQKCKEAAYGGFRTKLLGLQSLYRNKPVMLLVQANGITRPLWNGLTDKQIGEYQFQAPYIPEKIAIGSKNYPDQKSFLDPEIRILRSRENLSTHEVPEYYTELNKDGNCIASSGIYRFRNVFWGLESRPKNKEYLQSYKKSRFTSTTLSFDECGLVEYYPLQLQQEDDAEQWVACANYLREVMPETSRSVRLPAPLHFASLMEEYLLLAPPKK
ncbi:MAG: DUF3893 domain-containing protein, partial [Oscillospiraceae bacterium]|nr:DUF3893 domain-containing protein [Oscillospiraceae bacterium]